MHRRKKIVFLQVPQFIAFKRRRLNLKGFLKLYQKIIQGNTNYTSLYCKIKTTTGIITVSNSFYDVRWKTQKTKKPDFFTFRVE